MANEIISGAGTGPLAGRAPCSFAPELAFTGIFRQHLDDHPAIREAACLQQLLPGRLLPIGADDRFAGRVKPLPAVGFALERTTGCWGYYCREEELRRRMASEPVSAEEQHQIEEMIGFWRREATASGQVMDQMPAETVEATAGPVAGATGRLTGARVNLDKLVQVGIPGLINEIENGLEWALRGHGDPGLYEGMTSALCLLIDLCLHYGNEARDLSALEPHGSKRRGQLLRMADDLDHLIISRPDSLAQAIQLVRLYSLLAGVVDLGRIDVVLGDLYIREIDSGRLSEAQAGQLLQSFWRMMAGRDEGVHYQVVLGGRGRRNEINADRFALAAMEAFRKAGGAAPRLDLRIDRGMNPAVSSRARELAKADPAGVWLHDDEVVVPEVARAFGLSSEEAEQVVPSGSGGYIPGHLVFGLSDSYLDFSRVLELTLHNGWDPSIGRPLGPACGGLGDFGDFEELMAAYAEQIGYFAGQLARRHAVEFEVGGRQTAFLFHSMLVEGCLESGHSVTSGGPTLSGGLVESRALRGAARQLLAIREQVYVRAAMTSRQMLTALDGNRDWLNRDAGTERANVPDDPAGLMVNRISELAAKKMKAAAEAAGLDFLVLLPGKED